MKGCEPYTQPHDSPVDKLCTIPASGTQDSIRKGDSGGPLIVGGKVIGIVSTGNKYCTTEYPTALYTRISAVASGLNLPRA
ncbi:trypsin-like serine protease [Streptomyces sp. A5-4]|uniref:trypsin-like serine protease n=1 Tax=Streptomyces sp. A5-4 TaxID=3384771 RepID=UPI003DAA33B0